MQNTVTELSHRLLRSLDNNYNVTDMPAVIEIISTLERTSITEELLKTTRLGKYINELRRKTPNETLAKRAKELLKKWRDQVLPSPATANGTSCTPKAAATFAFANDRSNSPDLNLNRTNKKRPLSSLALDDSSNNGRKRAKLNGRHPANEHIYISDNSNSSLKEVKKNQNLINNVIIVNSDSNSSCHGESDRIPSLSDANLTFSGRNLNTSRNDIQLQQRVATPITLQQPPPSSIQNLKPEPKKRGRKKGSKNHKTLLVQAEESFTNKMAVSVNAKVKTTQELLASIQNKILKSTSTILKPQKVASPKFNNVIEGISSPKVTLEGVVKNDKFRNCYESKISSPGLRNDVKSSWSMKREVDSPIRIDLDSEASHGSIPESAHISKLKHDSSEENEIVNVVDAVPEPPQYEKGEQPPKLVESVEDILAKLPKVDHSFLYEENADEPPCTCIQPETIKSENITIEFHESTQGGSIFDVPDTLPPSDDSSELKSRTALVANEISVPEAWIDPACPAKAFFELKFGLTEREAAPDRVSALHTRFLDSINGNKCEKTANQRNCDVRDGGNSELYSQIVPNFHNREIIKKDITLDSLNYIKHKKILPYPLVSGDNNDRTKCCDDSQPSDLEECVETCNKSKSSPSVSVSSNLVDFNSQESNGDPPEIKQESPPAPKEQEALTHDTFREFHECVSIRSYNDELLHILPYVVLD